MEKIKITCTWPFIPLPHLHMHTCVRARAHTHTHLRAITFRMKLEAAQAETVLLGEAYHFLGIPAEWFNKILTQKKVWTRI